MAATAMIHVRLDENIKTQAAETLAAMGLSVSDAVRVFLTRVAAEKQLPFALRVPNARGGRNYPQWSCPFQQRRRTV
jgi:DNA-damage-inducible protein J